MIWILAAVFFASSVVLGLMLKSSREELESKRAELAATRHKATRELDEAKAEHDKALDRHQRHAAQRIEGAHLPLVTDLFEGLDALEMAIHNTRAHPNTTKQDLLDGIIMVHTSLTHALAKHEVTPISPSPRQDAFDPARHEAIGVVEDDALPAKTVAVLLRTGWQHPAKTLRPAMVQTSRTTAVGASTAHDEPTTLDFSSATPEESEEPVPHVEIAQVEQS